MISVIIPIHNDEEYIEACLQSVRGQTYQDLELILVDDHSEDKSLSIVQEQMRQDDRIRLITLEKNSGAFVARKRGVENANGEYILFCDADDAISEGLCEELLEIQKKEAVDILHFSTKVVDCGVGSRETERSKDFVEVYEGKLFREEVFRQCFVEEGYQYNLCNKLFKTSLCKKTFENMEDWHIPKANDLFMYFFLALNAKSYYGVRTEGKYYYYYGRGDTGKKQIDLKDLSLYDSYSNTLSIMRRLCEKEVCQEDILEQAFAKLVNRFVCDYWSVWKEGLSDNLKCRGFDRIVKTWDVEPVVESLFTLYGMNIGMLAEDILGADIFKPVKKKTKNIAVYYYRMGHGGVERVISLLIPLYLEMGYRVILITEEKADREDYDVPKCVSRYVIPKISVSAEGKASNKNRVHELQAILQKENIDTLCYHAATSPGLFYDLLISRLLGIKFILSKHELFSQGLVKNLDMIQNNISVYPLADKVIVLSRIEKIFWNILSVDAAYIPNPFNDHIRTNHEEEKQVIVWCGRLDPYQKRYQDIVPIMKKVAETIPDVRLKVYGSSETYEDLYRLKHMIAENGLEDNIEYCGYVSDVNEIYQDAKIHLVTSAYESFPMNVYESRIFGVPLVTYNMPYLEMLSGGKGYIAVRQGDTDKAAEAVIALLRNNEDWGKMAKEALESCKRYDNFLVKEKWREVFENMTPVFQTDERVNREDYAMILKTIAYHSMLGSENAKRTRLKLWQLRRDKIAYEIKLKVLQENMEVAVYPYGNIGRDTKDFLEQYGICVRFAVDRNPQDSEIPTVRIEELKDMDCSKFLFVICSNRGDIYEEIRSNIRKYVNDNNIYDLYPEHFE